MIVSANTGPVAVARPRLLSVPIGVLVLLHVLARVAAARALLDGALAKEALVDLVLVGVVVGADAGAAVLAGVGLDLVALLVVGGVRVGALHGALAKELFVDLVLVRVVVRADAGAAVGAGVRLDLVAVGVIAGGNVLAPDGRISLVV